MNDENTKDELNQQEILVIVKKLKKRYQLEEGDFIYQLAITLYKKGIRQNMFSMENYQRGIFLDEIVKYLIERKTKEDMNLYEKDIKQYEIKRYLTVADITESNHRLEKNTSIISIIEHPQKTLQKKAGKGVKKCQNYQK